MDDLDGFADDGVLLISGSSLINPLQSEEEEEEEGILSGEEEPGFLDLAQKCSIKVPKFASRTRRT